MDEEVAMLRHIIAHFQHFSSPSPPPPLYIDSPRCCILNVDDISMEDEHNNVIIRGGNCKTREHDNPSESKKPRKERCVKPSGRVASSEAMDEEIWNEFPEDLLEAVLARLPIATFFRLRSVCRKWNLYPQSSSFSQHCAQVAQTRFQPWLYAVTNEHVSLYDSFTKKWRHPANPSHAPKLILLPAASAGGLVCVRDLSHMQFYVCNPVTQSWKELPARSFRVWSRAIVAMTLDGDGFKIVLVSDYEFEVYDSFENKWTMRDIALNIKPPLNLSLWSQAVSVGTTVYFLRLIPEGVVSYDTRGGAWRQYEIPNPPSSSDTRLAECGGRVMLVGLLTRNAATCVCVWELQKMTLLWKEVDRMPNAWCLEFYGKYVTMTCLGNKGLLMMSLRSGQMDRLVAYDVITREWSKIPATTAPCGRNHSVAFYPRLTDSPYPRLTDSP